MSIDLDTLRALRDGGCDVADAVLVAEAGQRGPDYKTIREALDLMTKVGLEPDKTAKALVYLAQSIIDRVEDEYRGYFARDAHTGKRDSNASRRGLAKEVWQALREEVFQRDGYACTYCGSGDDLTCDHIVPLVRDGTNDLDNLTTACRPCNSSKGAKLVGEWAGRDCFQ